MNVARFESAAEFLGVAQPFLVAAEVENNLIFGIARAVAALGPSGGLRPLFATVLDGDRVVMCAFRTIPGKLGVTRALDSAALDALAADLVRHGPEVVQIHGPEPTVAELATRLAAMTGRSAALETSQRIHKLDVVTPLDRRPPGKFRRQRDDERELIRQWAMQFFADVGEHGDVRSLAAERVRDSRIYVWDDGRPVSMAAAINTSPGGVRVALVYTPLELRGRGYASACVEALSQHLLDEGREYCCLYTDLDNPTSNAIYRRLGYVPVCDAGLYRLTEG